jgi:signal peptidase II
MHHRQMSLAITLAILAADFLTKRWVLADIDLFRRGIPLIDGLLRFTYVRNPGAAFGIFEGARWPFVTVSVLAVIGLSYLLWRHRLSGRRTVAYSMILAGAAGNLIDRLFYDGLVVDFIEMGWRGHLFPVYNVADMGVSLGATLLILDMLLERGEEDEPTSFEEEPGSIGE